MAGLPPLLSNISDISHALYEAILEFGPTEAYRDSNKAIYSKLPAPPPHFTTHQPSRPSR